jgi:hypothetical protein
MRLRTDFHMDPSLEIGFRLREFLAVAHRLSSKAIIV